MTLVLGLDLGISGARAAIVDHHGERHGTGRTPCLHLTGAGVAEHDPTAWLHEVGPAAREAVGQAGVRAVDAIAVGALGPAPVLLDHDLVPLMPAPLFSMDPGAERHRAALVATGADVGPDHVRPRLLTWGETQPEAIARAAWVVDATGFLVATLVGRPVIDTVTAADHRLDGQLDAPAAPVPIPEPEDALAVAGFLHEAGADLLGLEPGSPIAVGTYDTFVDVAALPSERGDVALLLGSTLVIGTSSDGATPVPTGLRASPRVGPGSFVGGWTSTAGSALGWASRTVGGADAAAATEAAARLEPGGDGLLAFAALAGERAPVWDPLARGALVGLTTSSDAAAIVRAIVDGLALSTLDLFERLRPLVGEDPRVWVAGGGARNPTWLRATADALGVPLRIAHELADAGAAARFALRVLGIEPPPLRTETVEPDASRHDRYGELLPIYAELYPALADVMHRLARFPRPGGTR